MTMTMQSRLRGNRSYCQLLYTKSFPKPRTPAVLLVMSVRHLKNDLVEIVFRALQHSTTLTCCKDNVAAWGHQHRFDGCAMVKLLDSLIGP